VQPRCNPEVLVTFVMPGEQRSAEIMWVMRPEVAEALETLGWVSSLRVAGSHSSLGGL
jgi:hypothetical protein